MELCATAADDSIRFGIDPSPRATRTFRVERSERGKLERKREHPSGGIVGEAHLAEVDIPRGDQSLPTGVGTSILWPDTRTGVRISPDGKQVDHLSVLTDSVETISRYSA